MSRLDLNQRIPVFIVHWNRPAECARTVECFLAADLSLDITVVDNNSDAPNFKSLQIALPSGVELIRLDVNRGWGGGLNVLLRQWLATDAGDICLVSAHDALPEGDCLTQLIAAMRANDDIGIACPEYGVAHVPRYSPIRGAKLVSVTPRVAGTVETIAFPHGTLMGLQRACLEDVGLFDERYFAYGEEHDLGLRARRCGWDVAVVWGAVVHNPGTWTPTRVVQYLCDRNSLLLAREHGGTLPAAARALLMLARILSPSFVASRAARAQRLAPRWQAVRDYFRHSFGPPPASIIARPQTCA